MNPKEREALLIQEVTERLTNSPKRVFSPAEILSFLSQLRAERPFPRSLSERKFQRDLVKVGILHEINLTATYTFEAKRYHVGPFSEYELALSLKPGAYLSHGSAAQLHKLTEPEPTTIYINKEQSPKPSKPSLTRQSIGHSQASKGPPPMPSRTSKLE